MSCLLFVVVALLGLLGSHVWAVGNSSSSANSASPECVAEFVRDVKLVASSVGNGTAADESIEATVAQFLSKCLNSSVPALRPLNVLVPNTAYGYLEPMAKRFTLQTGLTVKHNYIDITKLSSEAVFSLANNPSEYDGWIMFPSSIADIAAAGGLAILDEFVKTDTVMNWPGLSKFHRSLSSVFNGHVVAVPQSGQMASLAYRRDLFRQRNLTVPATWDDVLQLAAQQNGTNFGNGGNNNGTTGHYSLCWQPATGCLQNQLLLGQILATMTQYQGTKSGWSFDPETLKYLVDNVAGERALQLLAELKRYTWPDTSCTLVERRFRSRQCLMTIISVPSFKDTQSVPGMKGNTASAQLPGSTLVYDRQADALVTCDATVCPYAEAVTRGDGTVVYVNRAPYSGISGTSGLVNALGDPGYTKPMYDYMAFLGSEKILNERVFSKVYPAGPIRDAEIDPLHVAPWVAAGFDELDIQEYLTVTQTYLHSDNVALDVRCPGAELYGASFQTAADECGTVSPQDILKELRARAAIIVRDSKIDYATVLEYYRRGLGYVPPRPPP